MRTLALMLLLFVAAPAASGQAPPSSRIAPDDAIRRILAERVDVAREAVGIVVGVIEPGGRRIVSYGAAARGDRRPLNGDTVFEIGSITKVFTSLLLADAVERKAVALSDPVNKFLPADATVPDRAGRQVTLQDLAQHVSALPRLPGNMNPADRTNPYADYSVKQMYAFLPTVQFTRDIGTEYEYSNLAVGLLGHVLALQAGQDYDTLVRTRITAPLGMTSTSITLSADQKARLAPGHGATLEPAPNWDLPTLAGAGALRSTANDMLTFLAAAMGQTRTPLAGAFAAMLEPRRPAGSSVMDIALGWHILKTADSEIVWHNGGTGGYRTFAGYDPAARTGVVVLSNATTPPGPDDIGRHLLNPRLPLRPAKGSTP